ncbi:MAG: sensor histidine kinase [Bacillus sp. (in: firmicutes)]
MKRLSIKMKVTLWYTALIILIVSAILVFIVATSDKLLLFQLEDTLKHNVHELAEELDFEHGKREDDDELELYDDGVRLLIYSGDGQLLEGTVPDGLSDVPFNDGNMQTSQQGQQEWLVYDLRTVVEDSQTVWIRGVTSLNVLSSTIDFITKLAFIIFPFFVVLAAVGGYLITRRAFKPIQQIIDSVNSISDGKDLTRRIDLQGNKDEIHLLAQTFDRMFDRLQKSFESEKQFTSDASHELRTPTAVIISQCEYGLSQSDNKEEMKSSLQVILKQAKKMASLISQLLMFARGDSKKARLVFEQINLSELTEMVVEELTETASEAEITMIADIQDDIDMKAEQTLMMRLWMNLISNAISYGKRGGWVKVQLFQDGEKVIGKVSDNGIGIEEQYQSKIWDRFYQVNASRTASDNHHLGLGLSMVKWIVDMHGGTIEVESKVGEGSTFTFELPLKNERTKSS